MQLRAEAPAFTVNASDGVAAQVQLMQGREAVEPASAHLHQAVVLQVPAKTAHRRESGLSRLPTAPHAGSPLRPTRVGTEEQPTVQERRGGLGAGGGAACSRVSGKDMGRTREPNSRP